MKLRPKGQMIWRKNGCPLINSVGTAPGHHSTARHGWQLSSTVWWGIPPQQHTPLRSVSRVLINLWLRLRVGFSLIRLFEICVRYSLGITEILRTIHRTNFWNSQAFGGAALMFSTGDVNAAAPFLSLHWKLLLSLQGTNSLCSSEEIISHYNRTREKSIKQKSVFIYS